jgi:hypothetical protein
MNSFYDLPIAEIPKDSYPESTVYTYIGVCATHTRRSISAKTQMSVSEIEELISFLRDDRPVVGTHTNR